MAQAQTTPKVRNKRATISDHAPEANADLGAAVKKHWDTIREALAKAGVKVGTTFTTPEGAFTTDVLAYPLPTILKLAQSRDHNKHMDAYADVVKNPDVIQTVREVNAELIQGNWSQRGEGGGGRFTLLHRAVARMNKVEPAEARDAIDEWIENGQTTKKALEADPDIKRVMDQLKIEDAQARAAQSAKAPAAPKVAAALFAGLRKKADAAEGQKATK